MKPVNFYIKATTQSEWDGCDVALVELTLPFINRLKQYQAKAIECNELEAFGSISFHFAPVTFLNDDESEIIEDTDEDNGINYVVSDKVFDDDCFSIPEQDIDCIMGYIDAKSIQFIGHGKHTSEEFSSQSVPLEAIFTAFNSGQ